MSLRKTYVKTQIMIFFSLIDIFIFWSRAFKLKTTTLITSSSFESWNSKVKTNTLTWQFRLRTKNFARIKHQFSNDLYIFLYNSNLSINVKRDNEIIELFEAKVLTRCLLLYVSIFNFSFKEKDKLSALIIRFCSNIRRTKKSFNEDLIVFNTSLNSLFRIISSLDIMTLKLISILKFLIKKNSFDKDLTKNLIRIDNIWVFITIYNDCIKRLISL